MKLRIALPKGRIAERALAIFEQICATQIAFSGRKLLCEAGDLQFLLVRNQDIPAYVQHQAADVGIVGLDVLEEQSSQLVRLLDLGFGHCRVVVASPVGIELDNTKPALRIATKMVNLAKSYFASQAVAVEIIKLYGSIELAPSVGLCDAIVDIVETGSTLKENALKIDAVILQSSAYLVANQNSFYAKRKAILNLRTQLQNVIETAR